MRILSLVAVLAIASVARADGSWTLTTSDFNRSSVVVASLDDQKLTGADREKPITVPIERLLRLDREGLETPSKAHFTLFTTNGDRLTGEAGDLKDESLAWTNPVLGPLKFPVDSLRAISRSPLAPAGLDEQRKEDQVTMTNRDVVRGVVGGIENGDILMQVNGDTSPVPLASADAVLFASPAKAEAETARAFRLRFVDGSRFTTRSVKLIGSTVVVTVPEGGTRNIDQANVLSIEQLNGPVRWLSDQTPKVSEQVPFNSEISFPARFDRNVFGQPLRVSSQTFEKGIGVHANSRLVFALDGTYKTFRARYAIDTTTDASKADVNVKVLLDDKVVHDQTHVRAYAAMPLLSIDLGSAKTLTLEVLAGGPTDTQDRLDWLDAALVREAAPATAPTTKPLVQEGSR